MVDVNVTQEDLDEYLEHHGVKGMRWGHRKPQDASAETKTTGQKVKQGLKVGGAVAAATVATSMAITAAQGLKKAHDLMKQYGATSIKDIFKVLDELG